MKKSECLFEEKSVLSQCCWWARCRRRMTLRTRRRRSRSAPRSPRRKSNVTAPTSTTVSPSSKTVSRTGLARVPTKYVGQYSEQDQHGCQQSMQVSIQNQTGMGTDKVCRSVSRTLPAWCQQSMQVSIQNQTGMGTNKVCRSVSRTGLAQLPMKYSTPHLA